MINTHARMYVFSRPMKNLDPNIIKANILSKAEKLDQNCGR